ncbi:hypothetical protein DTO195F2_5133 [Paecilomyces variotii]|nr:hypothetical protein DTO195F2_5133 [Paecilomyces variotii]
MNRFDAFRATSRNPPDGPPTGDELIRFVETVVRNMKSRYGEGHAISEYTIRGSISLLVDGLSFRYPDYRMTNGEAKRLDSCIARLRQEGKLIKGARKQGCFVGLILLRNMARAWIEDGLENGCRSWDIHISRLLSIVLMHACCSRAGDIALSQHYEGKACLLYEHIEVIVEKQPCLENVIMRVSLHYAKGEKDRPHEARTHIVRQYEAPELFAIDAVKLLLIYALCQGACASQKDPNSPLTTLDEVLQQAFLRRDYKVVWQIPQRPVICGIEQHGFLSADIPARTQQLRATIQDMGLKAGVCQKLSSYAVRYGSARDLAHVLAEAFPLTSAEYVARALGHSRKALHAGVTEMYMGGLGVDTTTARASHPFQDPFAPPVADESMKKKRRRKNSLELTSWC